MLFECLSPSPLPSTEKASQMLSLKSASTIDECPNSLGIQVNANEEIQKQHTNVSNFMIPKESDFLANENKVRLS